MASSLLPILQLRESSSFKCTSPWFIPNWNTLVRPVWSLYKVGEVNSIQRVQRFACTCVLRTGMQIIKSCCNFSHYQICSREDLCSMFGIVHGLYYSRRCFCHHNAQRVMHSFIESMFLCLSICSYLILL